MREKIFGSMCFAAPVPLNSFFYLIKMMIWKSLKASDSVAWIWLVKFH
jgi:hypothetical protein